LYHKSEFDNSAETVDERREECGICFTFSHRLPVVSREKMCPRGEKISEIWGESVVECGYFECGTEESLGDARKRQMIQTG
jgi:hypothetical protein